MADSVEETLKRIQSNKTVFGVIIVNNEGIPIKTTLDNSTTLQYIFLSMSLISKASSCVRDIDPTNELMFLRIQTKKNEIMIAQDTTHTMIVIQAPNKS